MDNESAPVTASAQMSGFTLTCDGVVIAIICGMQPVEAFNAKDERIVVGDVKICGKLPHHHDCCGNWITIVFPPPGMTDIFGIVK